MEPHLLLAALLLPTQVAAVAAEVKTLALETAEAEHAVVVMAAAMRRITRALLVVLTRGAAVVARQVVAPPAVGQQQAAQAVQVS